MAIPKKGTTPAGRKSVKMEADELTEKIKACVKEALDEQAEAKAEGEEGAETATAEVNPADISGLSCPEGEVDNSVFDRYLVPLYKQASYKPYIIAAMIFLAQVKDPVKALMDLDSADNKRKMF